MVEKPTYDELEKRVQELEKNESEYKSSMEALRNNEMPYLLLFEHANVGIFVAQDGYLKVPNPYLSQILGYSRSDLQEQPFSLFIHPEYQSLVNTRHQERLNGKSGLAQTYDFRVITKNGTNLWVQLCTVLIQFKGRPATLNFLHDITERKHMEEALREREGKYRLLFNMGVNAMFLVDDNTTQILECNNKASQLFGYSSQKLLSLKMTDLSTTPEETRRACQKKVLKQERVYKNKDGSLISVDITSEHFYLDNRSVHISAIRNITDKKLAEKALREKTKFLQNIIDTTSDLVSVTDMEGNFEFIGSSYSILGYDPDALVGRSVMELVHPDDYQETATAFAEFLTNREDGRKVEYRYLRVDGDYLWFETVGKFILDDAGNPKEILFSSRDVTDRKQAEESLMKSEKDLKKSQRIAHLGSWRLDLATNQVEWTEELYRMYGFDPTMPPPPYTEHMKLFSPESWERLSTSLSETATTGKPYELELETVKEDGSNGWMWVRGEAVNDAAGNIIGLWGAAQDITERKQAEKLLIKKEALFRGLFDHMTSGSAVYDVRNDGSKGTDYIIREFNRKSLEMEGKKTEEVMGRSLFDLRPNIDDYGLIPAMKKVWETGISAYFPTKIYQDEKFSNYYENHIFKLPSGEVVTIYNDVTDQKNQEKALQDSEQMYRTTFDAIPDSITVTRLKDGRYNYVNDGFCNITGYSRAEVIGKTPFEINLYVNPSDRERMAQTLRKNRELLNFEILFRRKNGTIFDSFFSARPVVIDGEDCLIALAKDVTELKRAEEEKAKLETQLTQAQKMESVGRLAGGVAHDFNNMLGVILGHVEFAQEKVEENHDLSDDLNEIQKAAQRSANLTKQLLTFARKDIISPKQIDLNDTVESMLNMLRRLIGEDLDLVWQPGAHIWSVKMDPSQIDQILANLCINAKDAISGVGKLTIETGKKTFDEKYCKDNPGFIPGDFSMLAVSDNGCGMDKTTLQNLFEPFFTTKEVGKGTGLGLATVYGIVKQNNGFINVYSEPGQGSTFKIYLPRLVVEEDTGKAMPDRKAAAGGTETILLVEDETSILRMTRMMLERKGYTVLTATTPADAMKKAKNHSDSIDLLMTDVVMPGMNGRDLAGQISTLFPDIGLLFMSGYTADVIAHQGVLDAGVAFIQKPFSLADMTEKVREVLDNASDNS